MTHRYKIRTFESGDRDAILTTGTIVIPLDRSFSLHAESVNDVERILCEYVRHRKLAASRVYQICPLIGNPESIRSIAISDQAVARKVLLNAAHGMYSEFRSIRYAESAKPVEDLTLQPESVTA